LHVLTSVERQLILSAPPKATLISINKWGQIGRLQDLATTRAAPDFQICRHKHEKPGLRPGFQSAFRKT